MRLFYVLYEKKNSCRKDLGSPVIKEEIKGDYIADDRDNGKEYQEF
jgi:hypothetical protein